MKKYLVTIVMAEDKEPEEVSEAAVSLVRRREYVFSLRLPGTGRDINRVKW